MSLTVLPPLIDQPSEEQTLVKQDIPCDILNPVRPATDIKTLGISEQQLYWYGETYKQREVNHLSQRHRLDGTNWLRENHHGSHE